MPALSSLLDDLTTRGELASISLDVRVDGREVFHHTTGMARLDPPLPAIDEQPYDLASVTKVLAGTAVIASLCGEGLIGLDTAVGDLLPDTPQHPDATRPIVVRDLLQHGSGLPAWHPFYRDVTGPFGTRATREQVLRAVRRTPPVAPPGVQHVYSDLGFMQLLQIAERATGQPFDVLFHERVKVPSGIDDLRYGWPHAAATEWPCPHRKIGIQGTVHDLNCAALGGVSTHAGLFGTSRAVSSLGEAFLRAVQGQTSDFHGAMLRMFWSQKGPGSHRCGWDGITPGASSTGRYFPPDSVGHLGYTGTSIWIAPSRNTVVALLTNRVHPLDDTAAIKRLRPVIHDAVAEHLGWTA